MLDEHFQCRYSTTPYNHEPRWPCLQPWLPWLWSTPSGPDYPVIKHDLLENPQFDDDFARNLHPDLVRRFPSHLWDSLRTPEGKGHSSHQILTILTHTSDIIWQSGGHRLFSRSMTAEEIYLTDPLRTHQSRPLHPRPRHLWYASSLLEIPPVKASKDTQNSWIFQGKPLWKCLFFEKYGWKL